MSPQAFRSRVNEYLDYGWELTEDRGDEYDLQYRDYGGLLAHTALLLFFFTAVWGNALYAGYRWLLRSQEATVSADDPPERWPAIDPRSAGGSLHYVGAFVLVFPFLLLLYAAIDLGTNPFGWLTAIGTGLGVLHLLPPVRRRLHDRGPLSEFGRTKTTDESVVYGGHQCVDCGTFVDTALERSYQERFSIAGIPLLTGDEGENYYCEDCASPNASTEPPAAPDWNHSPRDPTTRGDEAGNHRASGSNHPPNTGSPASRATRQGSTDPTVSGADGIGDREPSLSEQTNRDSPTVASPPDETEFEWQTGVESNADEHSQQATPKTDAKASSDSADDERDDAENDWVV